MSFRSTYTIPQREIVAGDAYWRSKTSKSIEHVGKLRRIRSPLGSVSSLLSSITLFMFSTHSASTSESYGHRLVHVSEDVGQQAVGPVTGDGVETP